MRERSGTPQLKRVHSAETLASHEPVLGLPPDPQAELEELMDEVKKEIEVRRRASGSKKNSKLGSKKSMEELLGEMKTALKDSKAA